MTNQCILIGRVIKIGEKYLLIKVPRSFKNDNDENIYKEDIIPIKVVGSIYEDVKKYCEEDSIVGIKGRVECLNNDNKIEIIAEKVTFLSTKKEES